jgi:hypothetical protein
MGSLPDMSENFTALITSKEVRYAHQLDWALQMISRIAVSYDDAVDLATDELRVLSVNAMLDSFYVNIRLMADFLVRDTSTKDFGPAAFGVEWTPVGRVIQDGRSGGDPVQNLHQYWDDSSKFVVHFGASRVPESVEELQESFPIGGTLFRQMATDAMRVCAPFLRKLINNTPAWTRGAVVPDRNTEPEAFNARLLHDRTEIVEKGFRAACKRLDLDADELLAAPEPEAEL